MGEMEMAEAFYPVDIGLLGLEEIICESNYLANAI